MLTDARTAWSRRRNLGEKKRSWGAKQKVQMKLTILANFQATLEKDIATTTNNFHTEVQILTEQIPKVFKYLTEPLQNQCHSSWSKASWLKQSWFIVMAGRNLWMLLRKTKVGSAREGCSGLYLFGFWISSVMKTAQPHWATPHNKRDFSVFKCTFYA